MEGRLEKIQKTVFLNEHINIYNNVIKDILNSFYVLKILFVT